MTGPTPLTPSRPGAAPHERRHSKARRLVPLAVMYAVLLAGVAGLVALSTRPHEPAVPAPTAQAGKVVLTVQSQGRQTRFDMRTLEALPQVTHTVHTPWYLRKVAFQGPLLRDVLAAAGAGSGSRIAAVAVNDYTAEIPFSDATEHDVIIALRMDGKPMPARDKGPLFVIYPYDSLPYEKRVHALDISVWQLDGLKVE